MTETPNKHEGRPRNPNWQHIPKGVRLTLSECAAILGIGRDTLLRNYVTVSAPRQLPEGVEVQRDGKTILIVRMR